VKDLERNVNILGINRLKVTIVFRGEMFWRLSWKLIVCRLQYDASKLKTVLQTMLRAWLSTNTLTPPTIDDATVLARSAAQASS
jgi:hypothetical protein